MGCDIYEYVEKFDGVEWQATEFIFVGDYRCYELFGMMANVRNYACVPFISQPRGMPRDTSEQTRNELLGCRHSYSYLMLRELVEYDYDQVFWNRRVTKNGYGEALAEEGEGVHETVRECLGEWYFKRLELLKDVGRLDEVRVVFCFDS